MPQIKDLKLVRSLSQKKFRTELGLFIAEGKKLVEESILSDWDIHSVYSTDADYTASHPGSFLVTSREMEQLSQLSTPSPYLAVIRQKKAVALTTTTKNILVLDGISDPGNLGTIIRTAEWFGISQVVCSENCVELYNPKVVQSTMGSIFRVSVITQDLLAFLPVLKSNGYRIAGADIQGENLFTYNFDSDKIAVVIGSESHGLSQGVRSLIDDVLTIPGRGEAESLNASIAAAIIMAEMSRNIG